MSDSPVGDNKDEALRRRTTAEIVSLRALVLSREEGLRDLFRRAASASPVPIELVEVTDATAACAAIADRIDIGYLDDALPDRDNVRVLAAARAAAAPPFTVQLTARPAGQPFASDGLASRPSRPEHAKMLVERSTRVRLPSKVLVVDDSSTMRSIVRKTLAATRFPFKMSETEEGLAALKLVRDGEFDLVFLDYNMPDFSGLETLSELKREKRRVSVVMITSTQNEALAKRARELGAAFLKKPFFPADIEAVLCGYYGLIALNPKRA
jgi:DNA-binding response OmpR family regulator